MTSFSLFANQLAPLTPAASEELEAQLKDKVFKKGDYLLKKGQVCRHLYFIDHGLVKSAFSNETDEFIMRFFPENSMLTILDSYLKEIPSLYDIVALEETSATMIAKKKMDELCVKHHCMEKMMRELVSLAAINMMARISEMLQEDATARYRNFLAEQSQLLNRISLGELAKYLGITHVSLSRIRAKK